MTTVVPPPPTPPPQALQAPQPTVLVSNPPATLSQLQVGTRLDVTVLGQGGTGQVQVQTPQGVLTLQTVFPLPPNANVVLQLQSLAPQLQFQIAAINGKPPLQSLRGTIDTPSGGPAAAGRAPVGTGAAPAGGSRAPAVNLTVGATVVATLVRSPSSANPASQSRPPLGGTVKTGPEGVGQGTVPATSQTARPAASAGGGRGPATPTPGLSTTAAGTQHGARIEGAPAPGRTGPGAATDGRTEGPATVRGLPTGTQVTVKILSLQSAAQEVPGRPLAPSPATAELAKGTTQTATVSGQTTTGQPIIQTAAGPLALATRTTLPPGSTVTFEITDTPVPPGARLQLAATASRQELLMSRDWQALREAVIVLQDAEPLAAQQVLNTAIPRPDAQLAANMLFFLAALRGGDIRAWLGDGPSRVLQRHKPDLLSRLGEEFRTIGRMADEPVSGDWRIAVVPFNSGEELKQVRVFMRRHGAQEDEDGEGGDPGTRFIVDVELSRLGRMQLDGLVRGGDKRLDLIVRSATPLPAHMRDDIRRIFQDACELTGMKGGATFQCAPPDFIEISPEAVIEDHLGLIV